MRSFYPFLLFTILNIVCLSCYGQLHIYADKEVHFEGGIPAFEMVAPFGDKIDIWMTGWSGLSLSTYNADLKLESSKKVSSTSRQLPVFFTLSNKYYSIIRDSGNTKIFVVNKNGVCVDKTKDLLANLEIKDSRLPKQQWSLEYFQQAGNFLYYLKQVNDAFSRKVSLTVSTLDSSFKLINKFNLDFNTNNEEWPVFSLSAIGDQLLLLNKLYKDDIAGLSISKIDPWKGVVRIKNIFPEGLNFSNNRILVFGDQVLLTSQVEQLETEHNDQELFTYLIKLNSNLDVVNSTFLNPAGLGKYYDKDFLYAPVLNRQLTLDGLFLVDYGVSVLNKGHEVKQNIRFTWLDSNLQIVKVLLSPVSNFDFLSCVLIFDNGQLNFYYEENSNLLYSKPQTSAYNLIQIKKGVLTTGSLRLNPPFVYLLPRTLQLDQSTFVIPYTNKSKLGLVKLSL